MKLNKKGFISTTVIYSFLLLFVVLILGVIGTYMAKDNLVNNIVESAKAELE